MCWLLILSPVLHLHLKFRFSGSIPLPKQFWFSSFRVGWKSIFVIYSLTYYHVHPGLRTTDQLLSYYSAICFSFISLLFQVPELEQWNQTVSGVLSAQRNLWRKNSRDAGSSLIDPDLDQVKVTSYLAIRSRGLKYMYNWVSLLYSRN